MRTPADRDHALVGRRSFLRSLAAGLVVPPARLRASEPGWRAGVATVDITPRTSMWMAGFAARTQASQGTAMPLLAKALALEAGDGRRAVLVTTDLLGLTAAITTRVAAQAERRHGLHREQLLFNASHTHCGPVVDDQLAVAYDLSDAQREAIRRYTAELEPQLAEVIDRSLQAMRPATLAHGTGRATFGANRRTQFTPGGPVDHTVPVMQVRDAAGLPMAIVFGYACHNTTLRHEMVEFHGDYAGVAQAALEQRHRGVTAFFVAGCGADINPSPRGTLELVDAHGRALADAVSVVLPALAPVPAVLRTSYTVVDLPFVGEAARERWLAALTIDRVYLDRYQSLMAAIRSRDGRLPQAQPAPVQVWRLGSDLAIVALGGEVVVDYALRLARDYPDLRVWAAGYSNDVFGYVPSARVLAEGGYEGADAMVYYGRPGPFDGTVEDRIHHAVRQQIAS